LLVALSQGNLSKIGVHSAHSPAVADSALRFERFLIALRRAPVVGAEVFGQPKIE
jgi:hypothetical protein